MRGDVGAQPRNEAGRLLRFVTVGIVNTAIGYGMILVGLLCGLDDYSANVAGFAVGLPISYALHRRHTFRVERRPTIREGATYLCAFLIAYGANLGVIAAGRAIGFEASAVLQAAAICCYAALLFVLTRLIFRQP